MNAKPRTGARPLATTLLWTGFLVGTLDISFALLHFTLRTGMDPMIVLRYVASAALGPQAFTGGNAMIFYGFLFHYIIAFCFTLLFFFIYPRIKLLQKSTVLTGLLYGVFVWAFMDLLVLPLTQVRQAPREALQVVIAMLILIAAIGLPLAVIARWYFARRLTANSF